MGLGASWAPTTPDGREMTGRELVAAAERVANQWEVATQAKDALFRIDALHTARSMQSRFERDLAQFLHDEECID